MDLISGTIVGGLVYDVFKLGVQDYLTCVKVALKDYLLKEEDYILIADDFSKASEEDKLTKETMESYFINKARNTKKIVEKYNQQVNINHSGSGDNIVHTGSGNIVLNKDSIAKKF